MSDFLRDQTRRIAEAAVRLQEQFLELYPGAPPPRIIVELPEGISGAEPLLVRLTLDPAARTEPPAPRWPVPEPPPGVRERMQERYEKAILEHALGLKLDSCKSCGSPGAAEFCFDLGCRKKERVCPACVEMLREAKLCKSMSDALRRLGLANEKPLSL